MTRILQYCVIASLLYSCIEYSPYAVTTRSEKINTQNLKLISRLPQKDTLRIIAMGDCQRFYALTEQFVDKVNTLNDVDFVLITGDLTDFGIEAEFEYMHETLERLNVPYVTVIGNHDLVYNGSKVFKEMYGPLDFSFSHSDIKFICANTNGREVGFNGTLPNLEWLENEIDSLEQNESFVVVGHVSPKTRDFDSKLKDPFLKMLERDKRFLFLLTGHEHETFLWKFEDYAVENINTASPSKKQFAKLKIWKTGYSYEVDEF